MNNRRKYRELVSYISEEDKFERQKQLEELSSVFNKNKKSQLNFIMYWGAGYKNRLQIEDCKALIFLYGALKVVERSYNKKVELTFIFTDTHAYLNGYNIENVFAYYKDISNEINVLNFNHLYMSEILLPYCKTAGYHDPFKFVDDLIVKSNVEVEQGYDTYPENGINRLLQSAVKHCKRISDSSNKVPYFSSSKSATIGYIKLNLFEREIIEKKFPDNVFITYVSKDEDFVLPRLPRLRIFSLRKGCRSRPWFCYQDNVITM